MKHLIISLVARASCRWAWLPLTFVCVVLPHVANGDTQATETFSNIKPSLAFVISKTKNVVSLGTAFCVYSSPDTSIFLTNRHVVDKDQAPRLILMAHPDKPVDGAVVRLGSSLDVALIAVPTGNVPVVTLSSSTPKEGQDIAIAGFPAMQIDLFVHKLGLAPSLHLGTISALIGSGALLEYDAQTDHGNSGGPLFDVGSGVVYGIVTWGNTGTTGAVQNNVAIAVQDLTQFFQNAHVTPNIGSSSLASTGTATASDSQPSPGPDLTACRNALSDFQSAYSDWSSAYNRYAVATKNTTAAAPSYVPTGPYAYMSYVGVEIYINLETKAIKSVIDSEEPKLQNAQSSLEGSGNIGLSRITGQLVNEIETADQYSSIWTQSRSRLIYTAAGGSIPPPVDQSAADEVRDAMNQISTIETQLRIGDPCAGV